MAEKDKWNRLEPKADSAFAKYVDKPELQGLLPALYPDVFPNLAAYTKSRADLSAILLTGIPSGVVPGFQNYTGPVKSDLLRLNLAIPPSNTPNDLGVVAGDAGRLPQRTPDRRRRGDHRAARDRRCDDPAGRPDVHPGRRGRRRHGRYDEHQRARCSRSSRISAFPVVGTRPCPAPPRRHERRHGREPVAGQGSVLLDIGDEIGALVVSMPAEMEGVEVEIRPLHALPPLEHGHHHEDGNVHHPHVAVVNRRSPAAGSRPWCSPTSSRAATGCT